MDLEESKKERVLVSVGVGVGDSKFRAIVFIKQEILVNRKLKAKKSEVVKWIYLYTVVRS